MTTSAPPSRPSQSTPAMIDLTRSAPLQELSAAYADRLAAIGAGARADDLALSDERIAALEASCFTEYSPRYTTVPDTALYLG